MSSSVKSQVPTQEVEQVISKLITQRKANTLYEFFFVGYLEIDKLLFYFILALLFTIAGLSMRVNDCNQKAGCFTNKEYDPFGTGIRFSQRRDDTGTNSSSLDERQYKPTMPAQSTVSNLTSTPESPNFSEYYGINADIKEGSVMIERENFENRALNMDELERSNKGL
jgi:hypothetical protein